MDGYSSASATSVFFGSSSSAVLSTNAMPTMLNPFYMINGEDSRFDHAVARMSEFQSLEHLLQGHGGQVRSSPLPRCIHACAP
jgi:hypothetical protein